MKPYFAKYLSVEGEIENGDSTLTREGKIIHNVLVEETATYEPEYSIDKGDKKVKLFLCSRDIQVGDKVYDKNDLNYPLWLNKIPKNDPELGEYLTEDKLYTYRNVSDTFKVIGEISPDALSYVKEGNEFDENEIRFQLGDFTPYEPESIDTISEEVFLSNIGKLKNNLSQWIEVKGPCGHFH